jgi:hypothetical protein
MVWDVCCCDLGHHDAEDALQASFLVLVRKAANVPRPAVDNCLYGVARQTAERLRAMAAKWLTHRGVVLSGGPFKAGLARQHTQVASRSDAMNSPGRHATHEGAWGGHGQETVPQRVGRATFKPSLRDVHLRAIPRRLCS